MKWILISIISLFVSSAWADNFSFLRDSPIRYFTEQDAILYKAATERVLNNYSDGKKMRWSNPKTQAGGVLVPSHTARENGVVCRNVTASITAESRSGQSTFRYCKIKGVWKIVS